MKSLLFLFIFFLPIYIIAQDRTEVKIYSSPLGIGEILKFEDKSVRFKEVISDSRCPKDVTCVWAGEARVRVEIFENGIFVEEKLITTNSSVTPVNFSFDDNVYSISAVHLLPYPTIERNNSDIQYTLHLSIKENL